MVPKRRIVERSEQITNEHTASAIVLPFRVSEKPPAGTAAETGGAILARKLSAMPAHGERPTQGAHALREWLRLALIVSLAVHAMVFVAFQMRFQDDLERAAGAAARASESGTTVLVEVVTMAALPSAPSPTDANDAEAEKPVPVPPQTPEGVATQAESETRIPLPDPAIVPPVEAAIERAEQPAPAREHAVQVAPPVENTAPPQSAAEAGVPKAPDVTAVAEPARPGPPAREAATPAERRQEKQPKRPASSAAASPSRAAGAHATSRAGGGGMADTGGQAPVSTYQAQVLAHLSRHRVYPPEAQSRGATGVVRVQFALARDGRVISARLVGSSGERILDEAGVAMVQRASPFPPFPPSISQASMSFAAPIRFDLR
jgi:protein TonB